MIPVYELPPSGLPDLHDASLADWEESVPGASLVDYDFYATGGATEGGGVDRVSLAFRVFLAWSSVRQQIYVAVDRYDDRFVGVGELLHLAIDGDHSGGLYVWTEEEIPDEVERRRQNYSQAQLYHLDPSLETGEVVLDSSRLLPAWTTDPPYADFGFDLLGEAPSQFTLEVALSCWDELGDDAETSRRSSLYAGKIVGLWMLVVDADEPHRNGVVFPASLHYLPGPTGDLPAWGLGGASDFADAELLACDVPGCSRGTSVLGDSWGRIKASLRNPQASP